MGGRGDMMGPPGGPHDGAGGGWGAPPMPRQPNPGQWGGPGGRWDHDSPTPGRRPHGHGGPMEDPSGTSLWGNKGNKSDSMVRSVSRILFEQYENISLIY